MTKFDVAFVALLAMGGLTYFSEWFLFGAFAVALGIIGWLFAESLGWVK